MLSLNEHQNRLWGSMLQIIDEYRHGRLSYIEMVGKLEGALDASDIKDQQLINRWYDLWTPLEINRATKGNDADPMEIANHLTIMEDFIKGAAKKIKQTGGQAA